MDIFKKALEDSSSDEDQGSLPPNKKGKVNYLALADKAKGAGQGARTEELFVLEEDEQPDDPATAKVDDYDVHFEKIQEVRKLHYQGYNADKNVRYMDNLRQAAEKRKREQLINSERIAAKQLKREGKELEGTERFLTEGYLKMLEENKKFVKNDEEKEKFNQLHSASGQGDMTSFFRQMYSQDMLFGGPVDVPINDVDLQKHRKAIDNEANVRLRESSDNRDDSDKTPSARSRSRSKEKPNRDSESPRKPIISFSLCPSKNTLRSPSPEKESLPAPPTDTKPAQPQVTLSREEKIRLAKEKLLQRKGQQPPQN
jgi:hypothetical protein